ncbi:MAG: PH domain-containing protein, partial [Dehalococcoidia bacterium]
LSTADLVNVQDMTVERSGLLQTTLNYGDIICQTASTSAGDFVLSGIPRPQEVQLLVDKERDRERTRGR